MAPANQMPPHSARTWDFKLVDVDGDGDLDQVVTTGSSGVRQVNVLYLNDGLGFFTNVSSTHMPQEPDDGGGLIVGDLDGDSDMDLVNGFSFPQLSLNTGAGKFVHAVVERRVPDWISARTVFVDVDADGDPDTVSADYSNRLALNDGGGRFTEVTATHMPSLTSESSDVAAGDIDGDGDADLVFARNGANYVYRNNGFGFFALATGPSNSDASQAVVLDDLDGDGDPDLVVGNGWYGGQQKHLYVNDGSGTFIDITATGLPAEADYTWELELGDFDGDGDLDLVCGNSPGQKLYLNNGSAQFSPPAAPMPSVQSWTRGLAAGDVDGDGDVDLFVSATSLHLLLNDGAAGFLDASAARLPALSSSVDGLRLADVDDDGDADLLLVHGGQAGLLLNDGSGTFADATALLLAASRIDEDVTATALAREPIPVNDREKLLDLPRRSPGSPRPASCRPSVRHGWDRALAERLPAVEQHEPPDHRDDAGARRR